jgi:hypothetical protein
MKNKDLIAKLQQEDPEMEVGIGCDCYFVKVSALCFTFVNSNSLNEAYNPTKNFKQSEYYNTKVLTLVKIEG